MAEGLNAYQRHVRRVFLHGAAQAAGRRMGTPWDEGSLGRNPHYARAMDAVAGCTDPDGAVDALTGVADAIQDWAETHQRDAGWADAALAMGWIRTAASGAWDVGPDTAPAP